MCVLLLGGVLVWSSDPDKAVWEHRGMDGGRAGVRGGVVCSNMSSLGTTVCLPQGNGTNTEQ